MGQVEGEEVELGGNGVKGMVLTFPGGPESKYLYRLLGQLKTMGLTPAAHGLEFQVMFLASPHASSVVPSQSASPRRR